MYLRDLQRVLPFQSFVLHRAASELPPFDTAKFSPAERAALALDRDALLALSPSALPANPYFDLLAAQTFLYPGGNLTPFLSDRQVGSEFLRRASLSDDVWVKWILADSLGLGADTFKTNDRLWTLYALRMYSRGKTIVEPLADAIVALPSRDPDVLQDLAEILTRLDRITDARKVFGSALLYLPAAETPRHATLLVKSADYDGALKQFETLAESDPQNAEIYYLSAISALDQKGDLTDDDRIQQAYYYERAGRPFSMLSALVIPMTEEIRKDAQGNEYKFSFVPEARRQHLPRAVQVVIDEAARTLRALGIPSSVIRKASLLRTFTLKSSLIHIISPDIVNSKNTSAIIVAAGTVFSREYVTLLRYIDGQCPAELPRSFRDACPSGQPLDEDYLAGRLRTSEPQYLQLVAEFARALLAQVEPSEKRTRIARLVAAALAWRDQPAEAAALLSPYVTSVSPADLHLELGTYYSAAGRLPEAIKTLKTALSLGYPDKIGASRRLAHALYANGQLRDALVSLQSVLTPTPDALDAYSDALSIALERKAFKTALNILNVLEKIDSPNSRSYVRKRIELLSKLGRTKEMVAELREHFDVTRDDTFIAAFAEATASALKEPPDPAGFPLWDGWLYFHYYSDRKVASGALPLIEQITRMLPDYVPFRERLGHLHGRLLKFKEAAAVFADLARADPFRTDDYRKLQQFYENLAQAPAQPPSA
jgi:tetratricopeptide (TPR) repeat protein